MLEREVSRRLVKKQISRNPCHIVIKRQERVSTPGGGYKVVDKELDPQTVRIFLSSLHAEQVSQTGGRFQVQKWGMLARWDADIKNEDTFEFSGRAFKVISLLPTSRNGQVTGYQVSIEEVG